MADRTAVVQPHPAAGLRCGLDGGVGAQGDQLGDLVVRQPDLDVLLAVGQTGEPDGADRSRPGFRRPGGHVHHQDVAAGHTAPAGQVAVDEQVVHAVRTGRGAPVGHLGAKRVQLDGHGPRTKHQPYAGRLGLRHGQLPVGALGAGPGRQSMRQRTVLGAFQVERAAQEFGGDGSADPGCRPGRGRGAGHGFVVLAVHDLSLSTEYPINKLSGARVGSDAAGSAGAAVVSSIEPFTRRGLLPGSGAAAGMGVARPRCAG